MTFPSTEVAPRIEIPHVDRVGDWYVQRVAYDGKVFLSHSNKHATHCTIMTPTEAVQLAQALLKQAQALTDETKA